jgi:hypothetical protein
VVGLILAVDIHRGMEQIRGEDGMKSPRLARAIGACSLEGTGLGRTGRGRQLGGNHEGAECFLDRKF